MKKILIATQQLRGGVVAKKEGSVPERAVLEAGGELTGAIAKSLGLTDDEEIQGLIDKGALTEVNAREAAGDGPTAAELAAVEKRATDAETNLDAANKAIQAHEATIAELTNHLAEARKLHTPEAATKFEAAIKPKG